MKTPHLSPVTIKSLRRTRQESLYEIVQRIAEIHARLAAHYGALALCVPDERQGLILTYLAGREMSLVEYLQRFLKESPGSTLHRRFKYVPDLVVEDLLETLAPKPTENIEELAELLQNIHNAIDEVYHPLNESMLPEDLSDIVDKLRLQEKEHLIEQLRAIRDE